MSQDADEVASGGASPDVLREERSVRSTYGIALALILLAVLTLIAAPALNASLEFGSALLQVVALVATLRVSGVRRRAMNGAAGVVLVVVVVATIAFVLGGVAGNALGLTLWLLVTAATIATIVIRLSRYGTINVQLVLGLLCVYLLLGLCFALAYALVQAFIPNGFAQGQQGISALTYYSFITIATVGYGDISPASPILRSMAVGEAMIGQLYLVSVVSLAVGRLSGREVLRRDR